MHLSQLPMLPRDFSSSYLSSPYLKTAIPLTPTSSVLFPFLFLASPGLSLVPYSSCNSPQAQGRNQPCVSSPWLKISHSSHPTFSISFLFFLASPDLSLLFDPYPRPQERNQPQCFVPMRCLNPSLAFPSHPPQTPARLIPAPPHSSSSLVPLIPPTPPWAPVCSQGSRRALCCLPRSSPFSLPPLEDSDLRV